MGDQLLPVFQSRWCILLQLLTRTNQGTLAILLHVILFSAPNVVCFRMQDGYESEKESFTLEEVRSITYTVQ